MFLHSAVFRIRDPQRGGVPSDRTVGDSGIDVIVTDKSHAKVADPVKTTSPPFQIPCALHLVYFYVPRIVGTNGIAISTEILRNIWDPNGNSHLKNDPTLEPLFEKSRNFLDSFFLRGSF